MPWSPDLTVSRYRANEKNTTHCSTRYLPGNTGRREGYVQVAPDEKGGGEEEYGKGCERRNGGAVGKLVDRAPDPEVHAPKAGRGLGRTYNSVLLVLGAKIFRSLMMTIVRSLNRSAHVKPGPSTITPSFGSMVAHERRAML